MFKFLSAAAVAALLFAGSVATAAPPVKKTGPGSTLPAPKPPVVKPAPKVVPKPPPPPPKKIVLPPSKPSVNPKSGPGATLPGIRRQ